MERKDEDVPSLSTETLIRQKPNKQVPSSSAESVANIEDILTDILLHLPAGTLTRFKRVSKHWLSLISSPSFRNSHAKRVDNKSLYICAVEECGDWYSRYRVQSIKLNDLFSFPDTTTPITIYPSKSKSKPNSSVLREVALLDGGDDVAYAMGWGVFGSQISLAGGLFLNTDKKIYYSPKPTYVLDTTLSEPRFVSSVIPAIKENEIHLPFLREIGGKLYVLSGECFTVFDPDTKVWDCLQPPPFPSETFSCSVLGSKIFTTGRSEPCMTFCFDVNCPHEKWAELGSNLFQFKGARFYYDSTLVLDSEEDEFEKLMFTLCFSRILVHSILLSDEGVPTEFKLVDSIDLPEFPSLADCDVLSYSSAHLGDRKVCFSFFYSNAPDARSLLVLPLEFAYSKSGADVSFNSPTGLDSRNYTSICGSFAARSLGYHLFKYDYSEDCSEDESYFRTAHLGGCFVL